MKKGDRYKTDSSDEIYTAESFFSEDNFYEDSDEAVKNSISNDPFIIVYNKEYGGYHILNDCVKV